MIVRWLGAYGKKGNLAESLIWELTQADAGALCAERIINNRSLIPHAHVGLLVKNRAILRKFRSDVYSRVNAKGKLVKTRNEGDAYSRHTECWVRPDYTGIVIDARISELALRACHRIAAEYKIPLLRLTRDRGLVPHK